MELQVALETRIQRLKNFLGFARGFFIRRNPFKSLGTNFAKCLKELLTVKKKLKMAEYRLRYHQHQLQKMESLIAENNEHVFLKGRKMNEIR